MTRCIWRLFLVCLPLFLPGAVLANLCVPDLSEFNQLVGKVGARAEIVTPAAGHLLLNGVDTVVKIVGDSADANLSYQLFTLEDDPADEKKPQIVQPITITSQVKDHNDILVSFRPNLNSSTATLLFVDCIPDAAADPDTTADPEPMTATFAVLSVQVSHNWDGLVWVGAFAVIIFGVVALMVRANLETLGSRKKALYFLFSDYRHEVSLSLVQLFIFTVAVILTAAYYFGRTGQLTDLSETVLLLLGISATTAVAGAWGDSMTNRLSWANWRWLDRHGAFQPVSPALDLRLSQLVTTRGEFDLYRYQALLFTLLVAPTFVIAAAYTLGSMEIPKGILTVLGLSQVTYLVGKFAYGATVTDFDTALTEELKKFKAGERLTQAGFDELKAQLHAAMGVTWANEALAGHLIEVADPGPVELAEVAAEVSAEAARNAWAQKADPAAALVQSEVAAAAATEATKALATFRQALYYSEAAAAAKTSAAAAQRAATAFAVIKAVPKPADVLQTPPALGAIPADPLP